MTFPEALDRDVQFVPVAWGPIYNWYGVSKAPSEPGRLPVALAMSLMSLFLLHIGLQSVFREGLRKGLGIFCLFIGGLIFAML